MANRWGNSDRLFWGGSKITADGDYSQEIKRCLLLGRKVMTNLDNILKSQNIILPIMVHLVKATIFPVFIDGCEIWTVKKAECWRIDAFELWHRRRLLRVPRTVLEKEMATHSSVLAWRIPGTGEPGGLPSLGSQTEATQQQQQQQDCKEIQPVHPKGNQPWIFNGRTAEAEIPILWLLDSKNWLIGKDPDAGKEWRWEEKGMAEDKMVGWHHRLNGHKFV